MHIALGPRHKLLFCLQLSWIQKPPDFMSMFPLRREPTCFMTKFGLLATEEEIGANNRIPSLTMGERVKQTHQLYTAAADYILQKMEVDWRWLTPPISKRNLLEITTFYKQVEWNCPHMGRVKNTIGQHEQSNTTIFTFLSKKQGTSYAWYWNTKRWQENWRNWNLRRKCTSRHRKYME